MPSAEIVFCDRCNTSIPEAALSDGSAVVRGGRAYCPSCLDAIGDESFHEELHFCDRCNVSISVTEIREGRAFFREGKLYCAKCVDAAVPGGWSSAQRDVSSGAVARSSQRPERVRRGERGSRVLRLTAVFALLFVAVVFSVGVLFFPDRLFSPGGGAVEDAKAPPATASPETSPPASRGEESEAEGDPAVRRDLAASTAAKEALDALRADLESLATRMSRLERRIETIESSERADDPSGAVRADELSRRVDGLAGSVAALQERMQSTTDAIRGSIEEIRASIADQATHESEAPEVAGGPEEKATAGPEPASDRPPARDDPSDAELASLRGALRSPEAGKRFSALVELGRRGDLETVPDIAEVLLHDEDFVVREFAASVLGSFGTTDAVPFLIRALQDSAASVVIAADEALSGITRKDFGMKRHSSQSARAEAVRKWEDWWERNRDDR